MFEDQRLKVFLTLAQKGSFTATAIALGISQPAVSQNIAELEKALGGLLFDRNRGSATLTEKGRLFKGYAEQIQHWYKAAEDAFKDGTEPEKPQVLGLSETKEAQIWASQGDIHIRIVEK